MAMTAWSAKVFEQLDLSFAEVAASSRPPGDETPIARPSRRIGTASDAADAESRRAAVDIVGILVDVGYFLDPTALRIARAAAVVRLGASG